MNLSDFRERALKAIIDANKDSPDGPILTGEKDLYIAKAELIERIQKNRYGDEYFDVIESEKDLLIGQGLLDGTIDTEGSIFFRIPDWDAFISAVNAFYVTCYQDE